MPQQPHSDPVNVCSALKLSSTTLIIHIISPFIFHLHINYAHERQGQRRYTFLGQGEFRRREKLASAQNLKLINPFVRVRYPFRAGTGFSLLLILLAELCFLEVKVTLESLMKGLSSSVYNLFSLFTIYSLSPVTT